MSIGRYFWIESCYWGGWEGIVFHSLSLRFHPSALSAVSERAPWTARPVLRPVYCACLISPRPKPGPLPLDPGRQPRHDSGLLPPLCPSLPPRAGHPPLTLFEPQIKLLARRDRRRLAMIAAWRRWRRPPPASSRARFLSELRTERLGERSARAWQSLAGWVCEARILKMGNALQDYFSK